MVAKLIPEPFSTIVAVPVLATVPVLVAVNMTVSLASEIESATIATRTNKLADSAGVASPSDGI